MKNLRLILGDQLNENHSWFQHVNADVVYVLMELRSETDYATHHIQKVIGFFAAMQHFAKLLREKGHQVHYFYLNDANNQQTFEKNCLYLIEKENFTKFEYQLPDEYRVDEHLKLTCAKMKIPHAVVDTEHFMSSRTTLPDFFQGKKNFIMENFYQMMRKKHDILMQGTTPLTGKWNYDTENRKKLPKEHKPIPPLVFNNDCSKIVVELQKTNVKTIGTVETASFLWPINREQALALLDHFLVHCLPLFGSFQDAMLPNEWSLYHSRLSFSLNCKMISPLEVIEKAIATYENNEDTIAYHQLEGFVRQIIGWREYMRGVYWNKMPEFSKMNFFNHQNKLPDWFWTGATKMNCLRDTINQSLQYAYAHHIQRLMLTGNFALLAGVHPDKVDAWYLGIYIDAIEWVEITNTRGMSQFADGGIVGTKPYVSSAAYIDKMSSYCSSCFYKKAVKTGDKACPFNSLYWHFYDKNTDKLSKNPRISMMYSVWNKMKPDEKEAILKQASYYLNNINQL